MGFGTGRPLPHCWVCGNEIQQAMREVSEKTIAVEPKFCRHCGSQLIRIDDLEDSETKFDELSDELDLDDLYDFDTLEKLIRAAVPENYKELSIEELRRQIVGRLWQRFRGIYPYITPEQQAAMDQYHEEMMQRCIAAGTPPGSITCITSAPRSWRDESLKEFVRRYHKVWVNGLTTHLSVTPEELEEMRPQIERNYFRIEPCDCDRVKYVPDETHPQYMRKVEE